MKNIILCAIDNDIDCLILGKWGCGAFGNDWDRFLNLWQLVIKENDFDKKENKCYNNIIRKKENKEGREG